MIEGRATPEGTARYAQRFASTVAADNYRRLDSAGHLSSLGLGTYLGHEDAATDSLYRRAICTFSPLRSIYEPSLYVINFP